MIEFKLYGSDLILQYDSDIDNSWLYSKIEKDNSINLKNTFHLDSSYLFGSSSGSDPDPDDIVEFKIGDLIGDYVVINPEVLGVDFKLHFHKDISLSRRTFVATKNVSIFRHINNLGIDDIHIGGKHPDAMPETEFNRLLKLFPNSYELNKYVAARVGSVLGQYFETKIDAEESYNQYLNKKSSIDLHSTVDKFREVELYKYKALLNKLEDMLKNEINYTEKEWQAEILQIVLLIFPKYIKVFQEVPVRDTYNKTTRSLDLLLVDAVGNVDIIEIKKPFEKAIVTGRKYRDNHIPLRELSGTVMQIEKYIFYLNKWGRAGERKLTKRYQTELPDKFNIKVTNPGGIIIIGRENELTAEQLSDFEVIKRKYKNVIDIISYDDLLLRLRFTIEQLLVDSDDNSTSNTSKTD